MTKRSDATPSDLVCRGLQILLLLWLSALTPAQHSSLQAWGDWTFDTRGRDGFVVDVNASLYQTAVLTADGRIYSNGSVYDTYNEVPSLPSGRRFVNMSVNPSGGSGVLDDGNILVWGQLNGFSNFYSSFAPAPALPAGTTYTEVHVGGGWFPPLSVIARRSDGAFVTWGDNTYGQLTLPSLPQGVTVAKVILRGTITYLIRSDGRVDIFGRITQGEDQIPPLPPGVGYIDVYAGTDHRLALRTDGEVVAWGSNSYGQCNVPSLPPGTTYAAIAAGRFHSHALRSDGVIVSWGLSLGSTPQILPVGMPCLQLAAGDWHAVARLANGRLLTWGVNGFYQSYVPGLFDLQGSRPGQLWFTDVAQGADHTVVRLSSGEIISFGSGSSTLLTTPAALRQYSFQKVAAGIWHSAALATTGELFAWGNNSHGESSVPALPQGVAYTDMALGPLHTVAVRSDGQAVAFGSNTSGESNIPPLPQGVGYVKCAAAYAFTQLVRTDGCVVSFGMGISNYATSTPPNGLRYVDVAAGQFVAGLLLSDGSAIGWLADPLHDRPVPQLPTGVYYVQVAAGDYHLALLRSDGQVEVAGRMTIQLDTVPPLDPGTSYVQVSAAANTITTRVGPMSTYVGFAAGCAGTRPATRLVPCSTPHIGKTLGVRLLDLPQNAAIVAFGWNRIPALSLGTWGLPGCYQNISVDAAIFVAGQDHEALYELPIPDWVGLVGVEFHNQAIVLDSGGNGLGVVVSDAATGVIGHW